MDENFLYKELSYKLLGICFQIHNDYGCGHNERIYSKLLLEKFNLDNISFTNQPKLKVFSKYTGKNIGVYIPDFILENKIILEIKATAIILARQNNQLFEYLKTSAYEIGYLINFGLPKLYYKRYIFTNNYKPHLK